MTERFIVPPAIDSAEKIVTRYFSLVNAEPYTYKGVIYDPRPLQISPLLFRNLICPANCGACCKAYSLDFLPGESKLPLTSRMIPFNGREVEVCTDNQSESGYYCHYLRQDDGRCGIHTHHPFSCDFEIVRAFTYADSSRANRLSTQYYGRGWAMRQVNGTRGAMCGIEGGFERARDDVSRKLRRLKDWTDHFELATRLPSILDWMGKLKEPITQAVVFD